MQLVHTNHTRRKAGQNGMEQLLGLSASMVAGETVRFPNCSLARAGATLNPEHQDKRSLKASREESEYIRSFSEITEEFCYHTDILGFWVNSASADGSPRFWVCASLTHRSALSGGEGNQFSRHFRQFYAFFIFFF